MIQALETNYKDFIIPEKKGFRYREVKGHICPEQTLEIMHLAKNSGKQYSVTSAVFYAWLAE